MDGDRLLTVLTNGSTGRNPTFFKAYGHSDVFGLRADLPRGCQVRRRRRRGRRRRGRRRRGGGARM